MQREHHRWFSPALGREMDLLAYGHYGRPMLVFPSANGRHFEFEDNRMVDTLAYFIDSGRIKVYCPDSVNEESWFNNGAPPAWRPLRHQHYQDYIVNEVAPFIRHHCQDQGLQFIGTGCSFGAYQALNFGLKFPWMYSHLICMSGVYDVKERVYGYYDDNIYFNNPPDYVPNLNDHGALEQIRRIRIVLAVAQGAWEGNCIAQTVDMSEKLNHKAIPHHLSLWGHEWPHDWPTWRSMIHHYISTLEG